MAIDQKVLIEYSDKAEAMFNKLAKPSEFSSLKKNKVALSSEERDEVMKRKAIWHHGPNGEPSPAVWKSINPMTKANIRGKDPIPAYVYGENFGKGVDYSKGEFY